MLALLADLGWKSALISAVALLASHALRRRSAGDRVVLLRVAVAALLALPLLALLAPPLELAVLPALDPVAATELPSPALLADSVMPEPDALWTPADALLPLYLTGAALVVLRLLAGLATLWRWTRKAVPATHPRWLAAMSRTSASLRRPIRLLVSPHVAAPLSWGLSPAWLLIAPGTELRVEQAEAVIAHEMAHVRRLDWPMLVASRIASALFWFNPLVWLVARELARQSELAADDDAVRHVAQADYAQVLLTVAGSGAYSAACGMTVTRSMLARRIRRVLEEAPRRPASRVFGVALLMCALAAAAPLAAMKLVRAPAAMLEPALPAAQAQPQPVSPVPARAIESRDPPRIARRERVRERARVKSVTAPQHDPTAQPASRAVIESARILMKPRPLMRHRTPRPPRPPAPIIVANVEAHGAYVRRRVPGADASPRERREAAEGMAKGANEMRRKAGDFERMAAVEGVPENARRDYLRTARAMRRSADKLDNDARGLIFQP